MVIPNSKCRLHAYDDGCQRKYEFLPTAVSTCWSLEDYVSHTTMGEYTFCVTRACCAPALAGATAATAFATTALPTVMPPRSALIRLDRSTHWAVLPHHQALTLDARADRAGAHAGKTQQERNGHGNGGRNADVSISRHT